MSTCLMPPPEAIPPTFKITQAGSVSGASAK
jgi:hypothetical protein